ncbi:MAG: DUF4143 domain-containing protein [Melioribacteraceae bacterium]|nr:DUF4143 domain-containing protein [Melioribacteraceae bacterium]
MGNAVFNSLKNYGEINYFQKRTGLEIDFILNKSIAFEVKTTWDISDIKRLKRLSAQLKTKEYYLISKII